MSKKSLSEEVIVRVKYNLDVSSQATAKKLEIKSFRISVSKDAEKILAHKVRSK